ncbi:protein serine/threonine phosphatase [Catenulispora acidiphila DSM 44928]|uniref:Protein serine/threonine phosphatase n=1 Tax=Catenulispora acidiphila (strain DSM 44928 / JCM 14897 / NBRC 102108 / NRRL B-24433 / ID139908) TaxID=479433 RepID=C7Q8E4_CATAD|nr:PP2C family protein-serine/threonine phosphatase [Catenulispora acidiphila]ACU76132.1 protein serine/threonine phosphatase [Catenulispora acidiphila DSM 44928]
MTADSGNGRSGRRAAVGRRRRIVGARFAESEIGRWLTDNAMASDLYLLPALGMVAVGFGMLTVAFPEAWTPAMLALPVLAGGLLMKLRGQLLLLVICIAVLMAVSWHRERAGVAFGSALAVFATAALVILTSRSRLRLGVQGTRGEAMLLDLRERLRAQGVVPRLPADWHVDMSIRSAGGQSFAGDFLIAALSHPAFPAQRRPVPVANAVGTSSVPGLAAASGTSAAPGPDPAANPHPTPTADFDDAPTQGQTLELSLVDVSGKGLAAGTRALLLSGAFGGLLGTVPSRDFLTSANKYLLRQDWDEGFATAVHLVVELETGHYRFHSAGHPPIARLTAKTGRWSTEEAEGPLLGILDDAEFPATEGCLDRGDALLLFTDGLVERPGRDLDEGLDRLLGAAETRLTTSFAGGADRLINEVAPNVKDDRALVVVWRT